MFAGPNGSGKSTLKDMLPPHLLGHYVNPDDLERELRTTPRFSFARFGLAPPAEADFVGFFTGHPLAQRAGLAERFAHLRLIAGEADFGATAPIGSYHTSILADWLRREFLGQRQSFSFETVMSSPDKVELLRLAQESGFRTYLYFVATQSPEINIERVRYRVTQGGHDVPADRIRERYGRSLDLLYDALRHCNRAYLFDNSGADRIWVAELTPEGDLLMQATPDQAPAWFFPAVLEKLLPPQ